MLAVVAEKTGYPAEMLTPEMSLDADLGIDSIKRVEIFSALQERLPDAPIIKPENLGTLQTLAEVIAFLAADLAPTPGPLTAKPAFQNPLRSITLKKSHRSCSRSSRKKTGYPTEMLNADMALDADLGIDSIKRVEIFSALQERLPDAPIVKPEHLGTLHSLGDVAKFLSAGPSGASVTGASGGKKKVS